MTYDIMMVRMSNIADEIKVYQNVYSKISNMPLDPRTFPRPPLLEKITKHLLVKWPGTNGGIIAETKSAYWVLETYHPPSQLFWGDSSGICHTDSNSILSPAVFNSSSARTDPKEHVLRVERSSDILQHQEPADRGECRESSVVL